MCCFVYAPYYDYEIQITFGSYKFRWIVLRKFRTSFILLIKSDSVSGRDFVMIVIHNAVVSSVYRSVSLLESQALSQKSG